MVQNRKEQLPLQNVSRMRTAGVRVAVLLVTAAVALIVFRTIAVFADDSPPSNTGAVSLVPTRTEHHKLTVDVYPTLRKLAIEKFQCPQERIPKVIDIEDSEELNAYASRDDGLPAISLTTGLLDVSAVISLLSLGETVVKQQRTFDAILAASRVEQQPASFHSTAFWSDFAQTKYLPSVWRSAFLSRIAFILAHETAHHCLAHLSGSVAEGSVTEGSTSDEVLEAIESDKPKKKNAKKIVVMRPRRGATAAPVDANLPFREKEAAADQWAVRLLFTAMQLDGPVELSFLSTEHLMSSGAELALIDAIKGRCRESGIELGFRHPVCYKRYLGIVRSVVDGALAPESFLRYVSYIGNVIYCLLNKQNPVAVFKKVSNGKIFLCDDDTPLAAVAAVIPGRAQAVGDDDFINVLVKVSSHLARPVLASAEFDDASLPPGWSQIFKGKSSAFALSETPKKPRTYQARIPKKKTENTFIRFIGGDDEKNSAFNVKLNGDVIIEGRLVGTRVIVHRQDEDEPLSVEKRVKNIY